MYSMYMYVWILAAKSYLVVPSSSFFTDLIHLKSIKGCHDPSTDSLGQARQDIIKYVDVSGCPFPSAF